MYEMLPGVRRARDGKSPEVVVAGMGFGEVAAVTLYRIEPLGRLPHRRLTIFSRTSVC
jgi:hypothetical protein